MRNIDDGDAFCAELPHELQETRRVGFVERRRRFVHDKDARLDRKRFGYFDDLLLRDREVAGPDLGANRRT
jgi:hypothetical protein